MLAKHVLLQLGIKEDRPLLPLKAINGTLYLLKFLLAINITSEGTLCTSIGEEALLNPNYCIIMVYLIKFSSFAWDTKLIP